jgi:hypothetical protein
LIYKSRESNPKTPRSLAGCSILLIAIGMSYRAFSKKPDSGGKNNGKKLWGKINSQHLPVRKYL